MGRAARHTTPSASGAIIFYGVNSQNTSDRPSPLTLRTLNDSSTSNCGDNVRSDAIPVASLPQRKDAQHFTHPKDILERRGLSTTQTVISLAKDILEIFKDIPYVQVVASLVQQIITISDEVQGNKDRSRELVSKVATYARVVFDALLGLRDHKMTGLEEDLLEIANVLQSIYEVLQYLSSSKSMSLFNRVVYRDDIASKLAEQDRRLDTTITAFQLKSSIVIRSSDESYRTDQDTKMPLIPPSPPRQVVGLRAKPQIFFGRSKETNTIVNVLLHESKLHGQRNSPDDDAESNDDEDPPTPSLCILGPGGIGKTTLVLSVMHQVDISKKFQERRFFISCEAATSPELFLNQVSLSLGIAMENVKHSILDSIVRHLGKLPCLVILDNFETTWDPMDARPEIEMILSQITSLPKVSLITTMRGSQKPAGTLWLNVLPPLQPIDMDSAISIFKTICHKKDKHATNLIRAVDCVPLAVTLLANMASVDGETTEALWARWEEESILMVENGQDRLNNLEVSVQLSLSSPRIQRDKGALDFLSIISLLPDGVSPATLLACEKGLPRIQSVKKAVSTLRQNALIYEDANKDLRVLSPIRLFMCARHPPSAKSRSFILDYFISLAVQGNQYHDAIVRSRLQREANNIDAILLEVLKTANDEILPDIVVATINFSHFTYTSGRGTTQAISCAIEKMRDMKTGPSVTIELPQPVLSTMKRAWPRALVGFGHAKSQKERSAPPAKNSQSTIDTMIKLRADCFGCLGQLLSRQSDFDLAQEKFLEAKCLHIKAGDQAGHAYDLLNIGLLLSIDSKTSSQALDTFREALKLHENLGDKVGMAHDVMGVGHVYRDLGKFSEAEKQFNLALALLIDAGNEAGQATVLNGLGTIMLSLSKSAEGERLFMDATRISIDIGDIVGEAENLAGLAVTFLLRSRFAEAQRTIQKAIALRQPFVDPEHLHILGRVYIAMGQPDLAKSLLSQSLSIQEELGDTRGQADNHMYLGFIQFDQGHAQGARYMAGEALDLQDNVLVEADINILVALADIRQLYLRKASTRLNTVMNQYTAVGCLLGRAQYLYVQGILCLRRARFDDAVEKFKEALSLHLEVENIQGQADDINKICEACLRQGVVEEAMKLICEALALHIQIDDKAGQGDDLYIQASLFLAQGRLADAESTVRQALNLHEMAGSVYGIARDCASLSEIIWQQHKQQEDQIQDHQNQNDQSYLHIKRALALFRKLGATREFHECRQQKRRIQGNEPLSNNTWLPYWTTTSDDEYSDDYSHIAYAGGSDSDF